MAYNFATDFVGLWRAVTGGVEKGEIPGLDFVVAALARAGILSPLVVSGTPPIVNQDTTAWFRTATPDYAAEGALYLWDSVTTTYLPATPALFLAFLGANSTTGGNFLTIFAGDGVPDDAIGQNGDFYLRLDAPGGIYGPKSAGMWPVDPLPGTSYSQISEFLDVLGTTQGDIIYRGASAWQVLAPGSAGQILTSGGAAANPAWASNSTNLDTFGSTQGDILYRNATVWTVLAPGTNGQFLTSGGAGANPSWTSTTGFSLDSIGSTQGDILYRNATVWTVLAPGTAGQILQSNGAAANPSWANTSIAVTSANLDALFGATQGSIIYRNASAWVALGPGTSGQFLKTNGAGADPAWDAATSTVPGIGDIGTYALDPNGGNSPVGPGGFPLSGTWVTVSFLSLFVTGAATNVSLCIRTA
jgi:hypothetical protein